MTTYSRERHKGRDKSKSLVADYKPADTVEEVSLESVVYRENADSSAGTGPEIARLSTDAVDQTPDAVGKASGSTQGAQRLTPITEVVPAARSNASGPATVVRTGGINTTVPNNSLFALTPNSAAHYLVETDPAFANYQNWLGSDYLLSALSIDPARVQKRLGDGFYEQKLIREQVAQLTGRRFLAGYENDEAQYRALMNSGVSFAKAHHLVPGVALSAAQMAQLTSDIVWLVEKDITLADGSTAKALVPQLYAQVQSGDLQAGGALIAGNNVQLDLTGNLLNSGTIAGRQVVSLSAENIDNLGGRILGQDAHLAARTDLNTIGGSITASDSLVATAGRDINVESKTRTQHNAQGSRTHVDRVAGLYVTGSAGTLLASAGRNANLIAAAIQNQGSGDTRITAKNNVNLGTVTQGQSDHIVWNHTTQRSDARQSEVGTQIQAQGNVRLQAGNDLNARAADVTSTHGALTAVAGNDVNLSAGQARAQIDDARQSRSRSSIFSSKTTTRRDTLDQTTAQATTFSGKTTTILADRDITLTGSNAVSDNGTTLVAKNNVRIQAATNTTQESQFKDEKKSGIFSGGGLSVTIGTQQQSTDKKGVSTTAAASTVGSTQGDVIIRAGQSYTQTGSDVLAPQGNIAIDAKRIEVLEARETSRDQTETQFRQSGLTIALSNPVTNAIQTAEQMKSAASKTSDSRMQALALASTALSAKNAMDAVQANPGEAGGINLSISIGSSSSQSNSTQTSNRAAGSTVAAGGNISMVASGAGQDSNLTIQGSTARAGNNIQLSADNKVNLLAAKNTTEQHGTNKNSSASIGVSFGTDGFLVTASASRGRGKADGNDVTWTNTHVDAGNQLSIRSGGDTTLQGAVASGKQVIADVGGNLKIESLQDTSQFASTQQSVGGSISVGVGKVGGSLNISKSNAKGDFASVTEQSGIKAGDGGFQINVKGNTDLKGAVITSTDRAAQDGRNSLNTATLTQSDIQNRDNHDASGFSIGISSSGGGSAGMGSDKGSQSSTTQSGISQAAVTITDNAKQQDLTGKTAAETVATLNRDASTDKNTSAALTRARDGNQLIADVQAQSQITAAFGANAAKQVGHYAGNKARELRSQGNDAEAKKWDEGGEYRVILHTAAGALGGGLQGAAGAAASATAMAEIGKAIDNMDVPAPVKQVLGAVAAAAIGTAAGGGAGAAAAFNTDLNNRQLHPSEEQWLKSRAKDFAKKEGISEQQAMERLTQQALKDVDYLWRSQSTDGNDAAAQEFLASSKQTFTNDLGEQQRLFTTNGQQLLRPEMFADTANPDFYKQFAQSGISRSLTDGLLKEFKDSGIDIKNSAADLAAKVRDNPGLVADAVWETVKNLPQSVVDNFKETGTAIGEGAAGLTQELSSKINAIYGTDTAAARKAILFIRTTTAIMGAGTAAKTATGAVETAEKTAAAIGKKLDNVLEEVKPSSTLASSTPSGSVLTDNTHVGIGNFLGNEKYSFTESAKKHLTEFVKHGENAGRLARPYMNSPLTIQGIMSTGKGIPDATFKDGMNWKVPGTFRGSQGTWELGINPNTGVVYHFNFKK